MVQEPLPPPPSLSASPAETRSRARKGGRLLHLDEERGGWGWCPRQGQGRAQAPAPAQSCWCCCLTSDLTCGRFLAVVSPFWPWAFLPPPDAQGTSSCPDLATMSCLDQCHCLVPNRLRRGAILLTAHHPSPARSARVDPSGHTPSFCSQVCREPLYRGCPSVLSLVSQRIYAALIFF